MYMYIIHVHEAEYMHSRTYMYMCKVGFFLMSMGSHQGFILEAIGMALKKVLGMLSGGCVEVLG